MVGAEAKRNKKKPQSDEINNVDETSLTCRVSDLAAELNEHVFKGRIFDARVTALKLKSMRNEVSDSSARSKIACVQHIIEETLDQAEHVDSLLHELH